MVLTPESIIDTLAMLQALELRDKLKAQKGASTLETSPEDPRVTPGVPQEKPPASTQGSDEAK